jgi:hypothetical protein
VLLDLPADVLDRVEEMLKGVLQRSMKACTPERFGEAVSVPSHEFQLPHCRLRISNLNFGGS